MADLDLKDYLFLFCGNVIKLEIDSLKKQIKQ